LSGRLRWRAGLGVGADAYGRHRVCSFQPGYALILALQTYKNEHRWRDGSGAAVADRTKHAAISVIMLGLGRGCLPVRGSRRFRTDRRHIEGIACGKSDHAKCRNRRKQLHQYREQHDWNEYFQPPSHDFPLGASNVLPPTSLRVEVTCGGALVSCVRPAVSQSQRSPAGINLNHRSFGC
jgi:hypothetical protein